MALTKNGHVFSWGYNGYYQLGHEENENLKTPKIIELKNIFIMKISAGNCHSLLLSSDGIIYAFGNNSRGEIGNGTKGFKRKITKLNHEKKFIDIASHHNYDISMALSDENIVYVWGEFYKECFLVPKETKFKSFNEIFVHYFEQNFEVSEELIEFNDFYSRNGYYNRNYDEIVKLGEGGFGEVFKVRVKNDPENFIAIKKIALKEDVKIQILREIQILSKYVIKKLDSEVTAYHFDAWVEKCSKNESFLFIGMDLCDITLKNLMDEMVNDIKFKDNQTLTTIGYYIACQLFIQILQSVQYLHEENIIHRDLNPYNIMLTIPQNSGKFIKILDFGLIAFHEFDGQLHSSDKGNIDYIAPEVYEGKKYNTKADIYSLGILLSELFVLDLNK
jgi:tRNA A-37 threonylcarbamoyl transferase component Bud32